MSQRVKNIIQSQSDLINQNNLITTNQDDLIHKEKTTPPSIPLVKDNNTEQQQNSNNNQIEPSLPMYSPFNSYNSMMYPYNGMMMGPSFGDNNTFFNKLFLTFERANYQMYHLCEMVKMIQQQLPTLKYFCSLIKQAYYYIIKKMKEIVDDMIRYIHHLKESLSYSNDNLPEERIKQQIETINKLIKITLFISALGYVLKLL